ncbi:zinc-binding dehydrogenase [Planctomonas sp. JC2975]|uniref:zinc-binding dehydrogenase n=1 Tax=Planctomonas sp. JC2975 TaxID=2729626 RepID=UPI0014750A89|nr:zinc-binding dehydrogenase [Planctomonas sp. JC2975]
MPDPQIGEYDAEVEMLWCGVCSSTDKMLRTGTFRGGVSYPSILGHESVGRVVAVGPTVRNLTVGDLVTRPAAYSAGVAPLAMHWGGFAERGVVHDFRAESEDRGTSRGTAPWVRLEPGTDPVAAALAISLSETFSVACREDLLGATVVVVGTGVAGLSLMRYASLLGAAHVIGVGRRAERLALAASAGATETLLADDAPVELARRREADVVFEASGQASMVGVEYGWLRRGGRLVVYSAPERTAEVDLMAAPRDVTLRVASTQETAVLPNIVRLVESGYLAIDEFVTLRVDLPDIANAFDAIGRGEVVKALVRLG